MKKHILLGIALASLFTLGACDYNEDNFPGFDEKETITDVRTDTLVLTDAHYGKIASMPKNQGLAPSKDPENQTYLTALNQLGKTKMFTIRKISNGVGVERIFPLYSPHIEHIEVNKVGVVRRARIYYLRNLTGKKARIKEKRMTK